MFIRSLQSPPDITEDPDLMRLKMDRLGLVQLSQIGMLRLLVSPEVHFPLEGATANVAGKGFEPRVFPAVGDEVGGLAESLAAHRALVRFLA
ncbi:hypothetical protein TNCT_592581 [Trichonephila clavata]|uniref:Uncharacterized protein n=1 Tax=Trichonephila clavata TaxID=2740835 RepID=A0A8X6LGV3_TRICU|nr:hypothetical protein TNCT_592581 [Trichonephila clavata]